MAIGQATPYLQTFAEGQGAAFEIFNVPFSTLTMLNSAGN